MVHERAFNTVFMKTLFDILGEGFARGEVAMLVTKTP